MSLNRNESNAHTITTTSAPYDMDTPTLSSSLSSSVALKGVTTDDTAPSIQQQHNHPNPLMQRILLEQCAVHAGVARHLSLVDLLLLGIGGTIGSGIFVLTGQIAAVYAGSFTWLSFLLAGLAAALCALCFAELAGRLCLSGSTYSYSYICLGPTAAVIAAACLTLEYAIAGAAVARSWGDKIYEYVGMSMAMSTSAVNLPAGAVSAVSTGLLLFGVQESKWATNFFTLLKLLIVAFMTIGGFLLWQGQSLPVPDGMGARGIVRGATSSFFGYLGYDEVCCVAGEAKHPQRDMARAVLGTLIVVTICYIAASLALTGMVDEIPTQDGSIVFGFPQAFAARGVDWAAQVTAIGELVTLPVVVWISLLAQPRLTMSMASDGLLPPRIFAHVNAAGNLTGGTWVAGMGMTLTALLVPFTYLDDLISAGILVAFSMTNSCLVLLRHSSPTNRPRLLKNALLMYNGLCFASAILWTHQSTGSLSKVQTIAATLTSALAVLVIVYIAWYCPRSQHFGGSILSSVEATHLQRQQQQHQQQHANVSFSYFETPLVPYLPCMGMAVNWYLIAQLEVLGLVLLVAYLLLVVGAYLGVQRCSGNRHPKTNAGSAYESVRRHDLNETDNDENDGVIRSEIAMSTLSLPAGRGDDRSERHTNGLT